MRSLSASFAFFVLVEKFLTWVFSYSSALDAESEYLVQDALQKLMVGRTTIIIAHRLSTIKAAHQVTVVDGGKIAESGTYGQLIQLEDGIFRKLVEKQSNMNER